MNANWISVEEFLPTENRKCLVQREYQLFFAVFRKNMWWPTPGSGGKFYVSRHLDPVDVWIGADHVLNGPST